MTEAESLKRAMSQMLVGAWMTQGIHVAAELGIADLLAAGPQTANELAERSGAHAASLYRVLRALASVGIFAEDAQGRFTLTPMAQYLRSDSPESQRAFAIMAGSEFYQAWGRLLHSAKTGEPGFHNAFGASFFQYMTDHPDRHAIYDAAMAGVHGPETQPMIEAYDFSPFHSLIDIGGGNGSTLAAILHRHPALRGILFDLPAVAERSRAAIVDSGLSDRCRVVGGDFLRSVPSADAYLMRHVIHDWQDEDATTILRNCRQAMNPGGRVLIVEMVIPPGNQPAFGKWLDLMMLLVAGRERTEEQYRQLLAEAGLKLARVIPTASEVSIIEAVQAPSVQ